MTDQQNPYEDACAAYEKALEKQGYNCGFVEDDAGFEDAHSLAIGAAVEVAVLAERERVLAEVERHAAGAWGWPAFIAKLREETGT